MGGSASLLFIGLTTLDVVAIPIELQPLEARRLIRTVHMAPAGTAAGAALVAARLGMRTSLCGAVGNDAMGRLVMTELARAGVDVSLVEIIEDLPTSATVIPIEASGRRGIYHAPGAGRGARVTQALEAAVRGAGAIHYAGIGSHNLDGGPGADLLESAARRGIMVTCDLISPSADAAMELRRIMPHVDVFMPSAIEARFLTGQDDLRHAAHMFRQWGAKSCVIKNGADGAIAVDANGIAQSIESVPVDTVVDTTSCGDSFCAGFIAATISKRPWLDALRFAAATAALVAQGPATLGRLTSFEQVDASLNEKDRP
jgi:sugar/nucleoside kinase (ribokinase family)